MDEKEKGRVPDFKGDGISVWVNKDKNGKKYLGIKLLNTISLAAFQYEPNPKQVQEPKATEPEEMLGGDDLDIIDII